MAETEISHKLDLSPELPANVKEIAVAQGEIDDIKCELVEQLRNLIFEKGEFTPHRTDDEYLIKFLRARYWSVEVTYKLLKNYYSFRDSSKTFYENVSCVHLISLAEEEIVTVSPYREQNGCRIMTIRFGAWDPSKISVDDFFRLAMVTIELGSMEPISQVCGGIGIFDLGGVTLNHILHLTPSVAQKMMSLIVTSSPFRVAAIHIVNQSWLFSGIINMFKPFLNARMKEKLFIHGNNMSSLHKHIEPKYLPKRYDGTIDHSVFPLSLWMDSMTSDENIMSQLKKLGYDTSNV